MGIHFTRLRMIKIALTKIVVSALMQQKQTPVSRPSLGPGQRFVIRGIRACLAFDPFHLGVSHSFISRGRV